MLTNISTTKTCISRAARCLVSDLLIFVWTKYKSYFRDSWEDLLFAYFTSACVFHVIFVHLWHVITFSQFSGLLWVENDLFRDWILFWVSILLCSLWFQAQRKKSSDDDDEVNLLINLHESKSKCCLSSLSSWTIIPKAICVSQADDEKLAQELQEKEDGVGRRTRKGPKKPAATASDIHCCLWTVHVVQFDSLWNSADVKKQDKRICS